MPDEPNLPPPALMPAVDVLPRPVIPNLILVHVAASNQRLSESLLLVTRALAIHFPDQVPADILVPLLNVNTEVAFTAELVRAVIEENPLERIPQ
jgi:hypothetical protein